MKMYHNPSCRKSRETLQIIRDAGKDPEIVLYLKETPSKSELKTLLKKLGLKAEDLIRKGEQVFKEKYKGREMTEEQWLEAMVKNPKLIERPIVVEGDRAVVGRPPEKVKELL